MAVETTRSKKRVDKNVNLQNVSPGHIFCRAFRRLTNRERLTLAGHLEGRLVCCLEEGEGEKRSQWDWKLLSTWTGLGRVTQLVVVDHGRDHTTRIDRSLRWLCRYLNVLNTRTTSRSRVSRGTHTLVHFRSVFFFVTDTAQLECLARARTTGSGQTR